MFILVCSLDLVIVEVDGFMEKFSDLKPEYEDGNLFSCDTAIDGTAVVCGKDKFVVTGASGATVVVMSEPAIGFFSQGLHNFVLK